MIIEQRKRTLMSWPTSSALGNRMTFSSTIESQHWQKSLAETREGWTHKGGHFFTVCMNTITTIAIDRRVSNRIRLTGIGTLDGGRDRSWGWR